MPAPFVKPNHVLAVVEEAVALVGGVDVPLSAVPLVFERVVVARPHPELAGALHLYVVEELVFAVCVLHGVGKPKFGVTHGGSLAKEGDDREVYEDAWYRQLHAVVNATPVLGTDLPASGFKEAPFRRQDGGR